MRIENEWKNKKTKNSIRLSTWPFNRCRFVCICESCCSLSCMKKTIYIHIYLRNDTKISLFSAFCSALQWSNNSYSTKNIKFETFQELCTHLVLVYITDMAVTTHIPLSGSTEILFLFHRIDDINTQQAVSRKKRIFSR